MRLERDQKPYGQRDIDQPHYQIRHPYQLVGPALLDFLDMVVASVLIPLLHPLVAVSAPATKNPSLALA